MTDIPASVPLLDRPEQVAEVCAALASHRRIAVDTEADSLHCYFEKLCLVQISVPGTDWLLDPLAPGVSLHPLFDALSGKEIIFHDADYDLRLLRRLGFGGEINVFDTMIAARLLGHTEFSLAALILKYHGIELVKSSQRANWAKRPLPQKMVDYAVNDTRFLHDIAARFERELHEKQRWDWFRQSCDRAVESTKTQRERDLEQVWRITGSGKLRDHAAAILRALWFWRDGEAQRADRPAFHILNNDVMIAAATKLAEGANFEVPHLRGSRLERYQKTVKEALALTSDQWPKFTQPPRQPRHPHFDPRFNMLRDRRDAHARRLEIDPSIIAARHVLEGLAAERQEIYDRLLPWQRELLGLTAGFDLGPELSRQPELLGGAE